MKLLILPFVSALCASAALGQNLSPSNFVPLAPCRAVDTRVVSHFGPTMAAGETRTFAIGGTCGLPASATAYLLNFTVVPRKNLRFGTIWTAGQPQPATSNINDPSGGPLANAVIVAPNSQGSLSVFVSDATDIVLDVYGYFNQTINVEECTPAIGAVNGTNRVFNLTAIPVGAPMVFVNGLKQSPNTGDYTIANNVLVWANSLTVPAGSDEVCVNYWHH